MVSFARVLEQGQGIDVVLHDHTNGTSHVALQFHKTLGPLVVDALSGQKYGSRICLTPAEARKLGETLIDAATKAEAYDSAQPKAD